MSFLELWSDITSTPGSYLESNLPVSLASFHLEWFFGLSWSFTTLTFVKSTGHLFCRMSPSLGLCGVSLWLHHGMHFGRNSTEVTLCHVCGISGSSHYWWMLTLIHLLSSHLVEGPDFIHWQVTVVPFIINYEFGGSYFESRFQVSQCSIPCST